MRDAPGVGLAAPQVGVSQQIAVIEDRPEYSRGTPADRERQPVDFHVLINPRIVEHSAEQVEFFEGCLSVAGFSALVKRAREVTVEYLDQHGAAKRLQARGWYARILQHEIDHLNGRLYLTRMNPQSFMSLDNFSRHWRDRDMQEARESLKLRDN